MQFTRENKMAKRTQDETNTERYKTKTNLRKIRMLMGSCISLDPLPATTNGWRREPGINCNSIRLRASDHRARRAAQRRGRASWRRSGSSWSKRTLEAARNPESLMRNIRTFGLGSACWCSWGPFVGSLE